MTILFADLIDFTTLSSRLSAKDLVRLLNGLFSEFDRLALDLGVEKIKTVGDAYMLASGLLHERFRLEPHGTVDIKGKGPMETFILLGRC